MNNVITILLIILAEVAVVEAIAIFMMLKRRKGTGASVNPDEARNVFKTIKGNTSHTESLTETLKNTYNVEEEKLQETLDTILRVEYSVYSTALKGVATGDCKAIIITQTKINELQEQYHILVRALDGQFNEKIEHLESCNKDLQFDIDKLSQELKTTLTTMESTLSEYANMYAARAATDEGDEQLSKLTESVDNAKQHATHTIIKAEEDAEGKRVPINQDDIEAHEKSAAGQPTEAVDTIKTTVIEEDLKTEENLESAPDNIPPEVPSEITFETMGEQTEKDKSNNKDAVVELNIDGDIEMQMEVSQNPTSEKDTNIEVASEEEITSFMVENGAEDQDSMLTIDSELDADIADLLNDATDIDLSDEMTDFSESSNLDSQLDQDSSLSREAKTAAK